MISDYKKEVIKKVQTALLNEVEFIRMSKNRNTDAKIDEVDVLFDIVHFLDDYEENVKVLNKHIKEKEKIR